MKDKNKWVQLEPKPIEMTLEKSEYRLVSFLLETLRNSDVNTIKLSFESNEFSNLIFTNEDPNVKITYIIDNDKITFIPLKLS